MPLPFFYTPFNLCQLRKTIQNFLPGLLLLFFGVDSKSQSPVYSFAPADSQFVMEVSRSKNEVDISIAFNDSMAFDNVAIERKADFSQEFSQCNYIGYDEVKKKGRKILKKDIYPYAASNDVQYRLKLTTADGVTRTYPPITLPATQK